jgi:hypothetical protein
MLPISWKLAGTSLLALGLAGSAAAYQDQPLENGALTQREAVSDGAIAGLKEELAKVSARLAALERSGGGNALGGPGDSSNPGWPRDTMRFALIGPLDVDRDGTDDRTWLGTRIMAADGIVDYDLPPPGVGKEAGELKGFIGWYVYDDRTPFGLPLNKAMKGLPGENEEFL